MRHPRVLLRGVTLLAKRAVAEAIGTAFLLAAIIGSGIMASDVATGNLGLLLFVNAAVTGAVLAALIVAFGPLSGAHFNPAVTLSLAAARSFPWHEVPAYVVGQVSGAIAGVAAANAMFNKPIFFFSHRVRYGADLWLGECIATFGLVAVIICCVRYRSLNTGLAVGAYIAAAIWFTSSTSFANPAVTIARSLSDTFAGIAPSGVVPFLLAQCLGALLAVAVFGWVMPKAVEVS